MIGAVGVEAANGSVVRRRAAFSRADRDERILDLWAKGLTSREITHLVSGITRAGVRTIVFEARRRGDLRAKVSKMTERKIVIKVQQVVWSGLADEAAHRDITLARLAAQIIAVVMQDNLLGAVLDDG